MLVSSIDFQLMHKFISAVINMHLTSFTFSLFQEKQFHVDQN